VNDHGSIPGRGSEGIIFFLRHPASYSVGSIDSFPGVKRPGREADHSHPSSTEVKNAWNYTSALSYTFMAWCLIKEDVSWRGT